ncbi:HIT family hydrolase, diadenosine tetraphosphate hydrolase [Candidatus Methanoperedens nitroreducens]|uniref:HIT family hydrolase, diadenosine tetraphosphate hydrolase n=1 Tax=Candidatus Methanoperedens nitratireducens TaxID=1392998 RepID=A0A062UW86_9EURY|nr:HIT family protein [Candidatus Methanoperedens nitroreducens]KCZ71276.1 HIT family hydrolase, diadenosine tetraphosphate hydrolase [Candidatus Methanoperedens nitroreducens]MDJ1420298.1 HIT family protein [Candidatus Methanoperedens sp.]
MSGCLFCNITIDSRLLINKYFYAIFDVHPVNPGHLLIISKRHTTDLFGLYESEFKYLHEIINQAKEMLDTKYKPDGYNVGINCGEDAGQTILHFHMHIIPRYKNDVENPKGGIRNIKQPIEYMGYFNRL